jgi:hypothetical protein
LLLQQAAQELDDREHQLANALLDFLGISACVWGVVRAA